MRKIDRSLKKTAHNLTCGLTAQVLKRYRSREMNESEFCVRSFKFLMSYQKKKERKKSEAVPDLKKMRLILQESLQ